MQRLLGLCFTIVLLTASSQAQNVISGKVVDAQTLEPLAAAHIIIKDTYKGTIANADGEFTLSVSEFPSTIVVRYLGYKTNEITIQEGHQDPLDF